MKLGCDVMELIQVGEKTYYLSNPTNIGIYLVDDCHIYLIDSGNDKDAGKKICRIVEEKGWKIKGIINTHSNADHIGGNQIIQNRISCDILGNQIEKAFTEYPILEPSFLYGGYPFKQLRNKTLLAKESVVLPIDENLPDGLEYFSLKGHFFDMIGIKTSDDVYFLGDSLFSEETISKYPIFFLYDVSEYLHTLDFLSTLQGRLFIPSHCEATTSLTSLIDCNRKMIYEILNTLCDICKNEMSFEEILQAVFLKYHLVMNENQYVLVGSTIRSYLSYLCDQGRLCYRFDQCRMLWSLGVGDSCE